MNYAQNHKDEFMTYLEDGRCSFSNNLSENAIQPFTVGARTGYPVTHQSVQMPAQWSIPWLRWTKHII